MRHFENEKKASKKRNLKKSQFQGKKKNILIAERKGISRENTVLSKLTV
jgi:hypothetical protein